MNGKTRMPSEAELLQYLKTVASELQVSRNRVQELENQTHEPIAIVGMACRYPGGVGSPEDLWELLDRGGDATDAFPANRGWALDGLYDPDPDQPGTCYARRSGFLYDADEFDADLFGINPREATAMDPQQRLLLETTWESLERAGINPMGERGRSVGVFVGALDQGHARRSTFDDGSEGYGLTGSTLSVASGRIAYVLGLRGPVLTVDTACSSSLVAVHLAAQSLRNGECTLALAGGVSVMSTPDTLIDFSRQRGLAPDGRCKPFSAAADGTALSEGVGMVVLERLSVAQARSHRILAVLSGSAVNSDGASNGLTAPNGVSQAAVIRLALADARLSPADIDAVEAHGTGTTLGDPIEAEALLSVFGPGRQPGNPVRLGSLKSNIGHAQAAAGIGGMIKTVLAMAHGRLPRTLHADEPTTHVDWSSGALRLLTDAEPWPHGDRPRRAGVSSFGISGTNAHVILEEPPADVRLRPETRKPAVVPWVISAKTVDALRAQATRLSAWAEVAVEDDATVAHALATTRAALDERAVIVAPDRADLLAGLTAVANGEPADGVLTAGGRAKGRTAFLFTGQGSQRAGAGRDLYATVPVFAAAVDEICAAFAPHLDHDLLDVLLAREGGDDAALLDRTDYTQAALFTLEVALFRLLRHWGVRPHYLLGHSVGEIAAAHAAGALTLADAVSLVATRGKLMLTSGSARPGAMVSVRAAEEDVLPLLAGHEDSVSIAAVNSPGALVLSGDEDAVLRIARTLEDAGHRTRRLRTAQAFHSPHVAGMLGDFRAALAGLSATEPAIPVISNLTGRPLTRDELGSPGYWARHVRETVRFGDAVRHLGDHGTTTFFELGPDPILSGAAEQNLTAPAVFVPLLRHDQSETRTVTTALAHAFLREQRIDWSAFFAGTAGDPPADLPTYPFQRRRYWLDQHPAPAGRSAAAHPWLDTTVELGDGTGWLCTGGFSTASDPWLRDHAVLGTTQLPGTAFVEIARHAGSRAGADLVDELTLELPLPLPENGTVRLQARVGAAGPDGRYPLSLFARVQNGDSPEQPWTRHATGFLAASATLPGTGLSEPWPPAHAEPVDVGDIYARLADLGYEYGPAFQGLRRVWRAGDELYAEVETGAEQQGTFGLHPALLDAALHPLVLGLLGEAAPGLPFVFSGVRLHTTHAAMLRVRLSRVAGAAAYAIHLSDPAGKPIADIGSVVLRPPAQTGPAGAFRLEWVDSGGADQQSRRWPVLPVSAAGEASALNTLALGSDLDVVLAVCAGGGDGDPAERAHELTRRVFELTRHWLADPATAGARLVFVTCGAMQPEHSHIDDDLAAAPLWGLIRTAQVEHPGRFVLVDTDDRDDTAAIATAVHLGHPETVIRSGRLHTPRLARAHDATGAPAATFGATGTVLVTGGTGTIGARLARHLVTAHGVRNLLLTSRRGSDAPGAGALHADLTALGAAVTIHACDTADRAAVRALLDRISPERPLAGIVHLAGIVDDGTLETLTARRLGAVLRPKVDAAWHLHDLTRDLDLTAFVVFSSVAALGSAGQAHYAAANSFLDALARHRTAQGRAATSLAWGLWDQAGGMTGHLDRTDRTRLERAGLVALSDTDGLALFDDAIRRPDTYLVAAGIDTAALLAAHPGSAFPLLRTLVRAPAARRTATRPVPAPWTAGALAAMPERDRAKLALDVVRTHVAGAIAHPDPAELDLERSFRDLGFDSLTGVELRNALSAATGLRLTPTLVFDHPTPAALARHLLTSVLAEPAASVSVSVRAATADDPIVIVGMACRYPGGVRSPEDLWRLVTTETDAIGDFPGDRGWDVDNLYDPDPAATGKSYTRSGGFLYDAADFDAGFFGMSPREALATDPQQRLLLETVWESLEGAGIDPVSLRGSDTGVFAGVMYHDYASRLASVPAEFEGHLLVGTQGSVASGRVSYAYGFEGPAITVDTACSSSLVSVHLAAQALRSGECSLALAGGVTVMSSPATFVEFSRQRGLAADGRCKPYSDAADGTGWSEGVGMLVLERQSDAVRRGHRVLAVVRGSAVNQDGASNGLTAPNGPSQERVIRQALASAGLSPADVDVVEGHGTGTPLGDPIEAQALLATYGQGRSEDRPLWLGSVKSNIGHTQAAAGVAGLIKMVLAMRHGTVPRSLHADTPTTHVDWESGEVRVVVTAQNWPETGRPRRAGVSSFGVSGTNAHVVLEQVSAQEASVGREPGDEPPWVLSARSAPALRDQARALLDLTGLNPSDTGWSLATRSVFPVRAVVGGTDRTAALAAIAAGEGIGTGTGGTGMVFVFPGQGSQWVGMGRRLTAESPVFADWMRRCGVALAPCTDWSLDEALAADGDDPLSDRVDVVQPLLWAVMVSLAELWRSYGVTPSAVIGHSQGEVAAACVSGVLSLDEGARVVAVRSRLIARSLSGRGGMVSVSAGADTVRGLLDETGGDLGIAAVNGPSAVIVSGGLAGLDRLLTLCGKRGLRARRVAVDYASHSAHVEAIRDALITELAGLSGAAPTVPWYSTVTGGPARPSAGDAEYWYQSLRSPVRFDEAVRAAADEGNSRFAECSPHPVLTAAVEGTVLGLGPDALVVGTLHRDDDRLARFHESLGEAYVGGVDVDWRVAFEGTQPRLVDLPTYRFQHRRYWLDAPAGHGDPTAAGLDTVDHPVLHAALTTAGTDTTILTGRLSSTDHPWIADHRVHGAAVLPGTGLAELVLTAGAAADCGRVAELTLTAPLIVPPGGVRLQVTVGPADTSGVRPVSVHSRASADDTAGWTLHAQATVAVADLPGPVPDQGTWPPAGAVELGLADGYAALEDRGYEYGPAFRGLRRAWTAGTDLLAEVELPGLGAGSWSTPHPALVDAALHAVLLAGTDERTMLPYAWTGIVRGGSSGHTLRARLSPAGVDAYRVHITDEAGRPVLSVDSLAMRAVTVGDLAPTRIDARDSLFEVVWRSAPLPVPSASSPVILECPSGATAAQVRAGTHQVLAALQDWLSDDNAPEQAAIVTRGAVAVDGGPVDLTGAAIWGLVRSAQIEHPDRFVLVDLDDIGDPAEAVARALSTGEPQVAIRGVRLYTPDLVPAQPARGAHPMLDPEGTVLVTGAGGTLGRAVARHLVTGWGARRLVLVGRRGPTPQLTALQAELADLGAAVTIVACDVSDRDALRLLLDSIPAPHPLIGVVHTAGVLADATLGALTADSLDTVLRPKFDAALHLHELTRDADLALFLLFSSVAGTIGGAGQANYAAANAALDALAANRRALGLAGQSLAWGLWADASGMTGDLTDADRKRLRRGGIRPMPTQGGLSLLDAAAAAGSAVLVPVVFDLQALASAERVPPLLRGLVRSVPPSIGVRRGEDVGTSVPSVVRRLAGLEPDEQQRILALMIGGIAADVLGYDHGEVVEPRRAFKELGVDSLMALELRNRLNAATGLRLPPTVIFDHPDIAHLAAHLANQVTGPAPDASAAVQRRVADDPVVIVGMACRYPGGVASPDDLWRLVLDGADGITGFPVNRGWDPDIYHPEPGRAGHTYTRFGGFLHDADGFDAEFFGISPNEALSMDPQQRLLLEVSWEAIEAAGIDPVALRGSDTGVFAGVMYHEYGTHAGEVPEGVAGYLGSGSAGSIATGRVAYHLGIEGPAITVDTACSSSLVSVHLAAQSLRSGECSMALAGGVTVMATPGVFVDFGHQRVLSADGRCKSYGDGADGSGFAEGVGVLLLERLSDAQRHGHPVVAVLRGSAVNQDGASNGMTAPNGTAQQRVIRQALASAGLAARDVDLVEGHGTGTRLGDPIEAGALLATYGQDRDTPLWLGSIKSNIGHTQAAAGVAGVIKVVEAMRCGVLPGSLHADLPSSQVDWSSGAVEVLTASRPWPRTDRARRAGVSSFGLSGTNAHLILEQPADQSADLPVDQPAPVSVPWIVSGRTPQALRAQAQRLISVVGDARPLDVGTSLAACRTAFEHRAVVLGADRTVLLDGLAAIADERPAAHVVSGTAGGSGTIFVFPGQGSHWVGMAASLADTSPVFAARLAECGAALSEFVDWSLVDVIREGLPLDRLDVLQPALFGVMVSLAELWRSYGVVPSGVIGHSQGEVAAACVAGALSLRDAACVVAVRSRLVETVRGAGAMVSVMAPVADVEALVEKFGDRLAVAAVNSPTVVTVSGGSTAVEEFERSLAKRRMMRMRVPGVDFAAHSRHVEAIRDDLISGLAGIEPMPSRVPFYSTVTGAEVDTTGLGPDYWYRNLRQTTLFADATAAACGDGNRTFLESSAMPVLALAIEQTLEAAGTSAVTLGTLRQDQGGPERFTTAVAEAFALGVPVDWSAMFAGSGARNVPLPTYAFQHRPYWLKPVQPARTEVAWRHEQQWQPVPVPQAPPVAGAWLVVTAGGDAEPHVTALAGADTPVLRIDLIEPSPSREELARRISATAGTTTIAAVVSLLALREDPLPGHEAVPAGLAGNVALIQALDAAAVGAPLWLLTSGAVATGPADPIRTACGSMTWGLGRVFALEFPDRRGGLIDLPGVLDTGSAGLLRAMLAGALDEDQLVLRSGRAYARRIVPQPAAPADSSWTPTGTVLVTGGTGAVGAHVARWLTERGAEHLLLVSRQGGAADGAAELGAELTGLGTGVTIASCDVSNRQALADLLATVPESRPLSAVFHAAAVLDDGVLSSLTPQRLARVLGPKADAARHLHELTENLDLTAFVLFSSIAGVLGNAGQAGYAAANAYLDGLAGQRAARGLPATSIAWGAWQGSSLAADGVGSGRFARDGVTAMAPADALAALGTTLDRGDTCVIVADIDWDTWTRAQQSGPAAEDRSFLALLTQLPPAERDRRLVATVQAEAAVVLGHADPEAVQPDRAFRDLGFDSLMAVRFRNRVAATTGLTLPTTLAFDYPTPQVLAEHLRDSLLGVAALPVPVPVVTPATGTDPVVIVGMACRYPGGVRSPEDLWELVADGRDVISEFPGDRYWSDVYDPDGSRPGTSSVRHGGFLQGMADFDADFFGISPREALAMDPQQRLLLEVAWEALERAGIDPRSVHGTDAGVFIGTNGQDYGEVQQTAQGVEGYTIAGRSASVISGRVAYVLGCGGPAVTVDTACSSSLVALHLAAQAVRSGEAPLALVGGVSVMSTVSTFVEFSRQGGLSADGRCRSFGEGAGGTGWSEGVGVLVVELLSDARRKGHRILAVMRGSAVNQDGSSNGLTAPNGVAQQRVIRQALASAGLSARDVDLVEGHGSGTRLGDPIEAGALLAAYGRDRDTPLRLGSIKSNIGHTQAAAGMAGVIKVVEAMRAGVMPRSLHADTPSSQVDWITGAVEVLSQSHEWPAPGRPRRGGVSSFGISGTNAHVILEEPAAGGAAGTGARPAVVPWVLSGKTPEALRTTARELLPHAGDDPADVGFTLATGRAAFEHRAAIVAGDRAGFEAALTALAEGAEHPDVHTGQTRTTRLAMLFTGQGAQRVGMGCELYDRYAVYATALDDVLSRLDVRDVLFGDDEDLLCRTGNTQPAMFAVQVALYRLAESWGIVPDHVAGHSIGEIAAAHVAGVFSLDDACTLVAERARLMQALPEGGAMVALRAAEDDVLPFLTDEVSIAAVNRADAVVIAGGRAAVDRVAAHFDKPRTLRVSHAFHSPLMEPMLADFRAVVSRLTFSAPAIPMVVVGGDVTDPEYWVRHVRDTVRFADTLARLDGYGVGVYLEIGPDAVLSALAPQDAVAVAMLRRNRADETTALSALARLHVAGTRVDWPAVFPGAGLADLPTYPFQHRRFWPRARTGGPGLPILGAGTELPATGGYVFTGELSCDTLSWLADHVVHGRILFPGTGFLDLAVRAGQAVDYGVVAELTLETPLVLPEHGRTQLNVVVDGPAGDGRRQLAVYARPGDGDRSWTRHASGQLARTATPTEGPFPVWPPTAPAADLAGYYDDLAASGFVYGPSFRGLTSVRQGDGEVFAEVAIDEDVSAHGVHPALLDAALHASGFLGQMAGLPFNWSGVTVHTTGMSRLRVRLERLGPNEMSLRATDELGRLVISADSLVLREPPRGAAVANEAMFAVEWQAYTPGQQPAGEVAVRDVGDAVEALAAIQEWLRTRSGVLALVTRGAAGPGAPVPDVAAAGVWGLVRSAQAEHTGRFLLVDSDGLADAAVLRAAVGDGESELALSGGQAFVPRLVRKSVDPASPVLAMDPGSTVVITGGTGTIGGHIARHLVAEHGVRNLLLLSRRGPDAQGADALLAELGGGARAEAVDVTDRVAVAEALAGVRVGGIVHAAGVLDDGVIENLSPERLQAVVAAKATSALVLNELTRDARPAFFVLFSSLAGTIGSPGQGAYAAANAMLDALATRRRAAGLPGQSLAWGLWAQLSDMTAGMSESDRARVARAGILPMSVQDGLALFDAALRSDAPVLVPARLDLSVSAAPPMLRALVRRPQRPGPQPGDVHRLMTGRTAEERQQVLLDLVREHAAAVLGHESAAPVGINRAFSELGFDSLNAVEFRNRLNAATGLSLPATLVFEYASAAEVAGLLARTLAPEPNVPDDAGENDRRFDTIDEMDADSLIDMVLKGADTTEDEVH
jgi:polyene macrolide polyketide synthase